MEGVDKQMRKNILFPVQSKWASSQQFYHFKWNILYLLNTSTLTVVTLLILNKNHTKTTIQVATILVAMAPKILELVTWFVKKSP